MGKSVFLKKRVLVTWRNARGVKGNVIYICNYLQGLNLVWSFSTEVLQAFCTDHVFIGWEMPASLAFAY